MIGFSIWRRLAAWYFILVLLRLPLRMRIVLLEVLIPVGGLVRCRGVARFRFVRLGGPKVRNARGNAADPLDGGCLHVSKVVMDVLGGMLRNGFSLARSLVFLGLAWYILPSLISCEVLVGFVRWWKGCIVGFVSSFTRLLY